MVTYSQYAPEFMKYIFFLSSFKINITCFECLCSIEYMDVSGIRNDVSVVLTPFFHKKEVQFSLFKSQTI